LAQSVVSRLSPTPKPKSGPRRYLMFFLLPQLTTDYQCRSALILHPETCSPRCRILLLSYQQQPQNWLPAKVKPDKLWIHEALQSFRIEPDSYEVWACFYSFQLCFLQLLPSVLIFTPSAAEATRPFVSCHSPRFAASRTPRPVSDDRILPQIYLWIAHNLISFKS
jgi:hypothetical protein